MGVGSRCWSARVRTWSSRGLAAPRSACGHLERWAEMLQILKDISTNRMPSVADLLKEASQAPSLASKPTGNKAADGRAGPGGRGRGAPPSPKKENAALRRSRKSPTWNRRRTHPRRKGCRRLLRGKVLAATRPWRNDPDGQAVGHAPPPPPASDKVDEAVNAQRDLLAEFEKIADELNRVLANLEGALWSSV